jgi:hypothetical protein
MSSTEYMREYRARKGGRTDADRAVSRAMAAAVRMIREECPDIWHDLLREARLSLGLPVEEGPNGQFTFEREHGTARGYRQHTYRKENTCGPCRDAWARHERNRRR